VSEVVISLARAYARMGWRLHPCRPGEKLPILSDWPNRATTDQSIIERWWGRSSDANVAVATGQRSGIFVLDVDGHDGELALMKLEQEHGHLPDACPIQWTGGGRDGWQMLFAYPEGREIRNSAGRLGPKLDTRGEGGYVLLPPSWTTQAYRWATERDPWSMPVQPAPDWLLDLLDPPPAARTPWQASSFSPSEDRYVLRALEAELAIVASAPDGRRNDQLNESAFSLFRFAVEGRLSADAVAHGLEAAARHAGLSDREAARTIRSAARARGLTL
jgi:hypothetical protein